MFAGIGCPSFLFVSRVEADGRMGKTVRQFLRRARVERTMEARRDSGTHRRLRIRHQGLHRHRHRLHRAVSCQGPRGTFRQGKQQLGEDSLSEVMVLGSWWIVEAVARGSEPVRGEITEGRPYKVWQLWQKGTDAWSLGLTGASDIGMVSWSDRGIRHRQGAYSRPRLRLTTHLSRRFARPGLLAVP